MSFAIIKNGFEFKTVSGKTRQYPDTFWNERKVEFVEGVTNGTYFETRDAAENEINYHDLTDVKIVEV
jgi:hypothetical protein